MSKPRRSHSWALRFSSGDPELRALSPLARDGWDYARAFARNAEERSKAGLAHEEVLPERLTAAGLAEENETSPIEVNKAIMQARLELFGPNARSYSAITYRLKQRRDRGRRTCAEPDCAVLLSDLAHGSRRYCPHHGTARARVARHRRAQTFR